MPKNTSNQPSSPRKRTPTRTSGPGDIVVRATRRSEPDLRRLARALIELAQQEATRKSSAGEPATQPPTDGEAA